MADHFDLIVIGSGPAGEKGAAQAAFFGKRVAMIERTPYLGGAGINTGTVPSKALRETALYFSGLRQRGLYGIDYSLKNALTVADLMYRERQVVKHERAAILRNFERHQVQIFQGAASLRDPHTVIVKNEVAELVLGADVILIATGSSPLHPPNIAFDHDVIYDSDSILHMNRIPKTMAVVGGGVIGTEYASVFTALGVEVYLIEPRGRLLPFVDSEIVERLMRQMRYLGMKYILGDSMASIQRKEDRVELTLESGGRLNVDIALIAAGRESNVGGLNLEEVGVKTGRRGLILVDEKYQTSVPSIFAAGDVIGFPALASTSMEQARVAVGHAFNLNYNEKVSPILPLAVYAIPELSLVGLTEDECIAKKLDYVVGRTFYDKNARGQIIGDTSGMVKLIFRRADRKLIGAHLIGEQASELVHVAALAMMNDGGISTFIDAVYNYPTLSECFKYAAYDGLRNMKEQ